MLSLLKFLDGPWEKVREYLRSDLDHIEVALNQQRAATFNEDNTLKGITIPGDSNIDTRYVANTGSNHSPRWDQVNLSNGVKNRLPFAHLVPATRPSVIVGREGTTAGDFEELTLGAGLSIQGRVLSAFSGNGPDGSEGEEGLQGPPGQQGLRGVAGLAVPGLDGENGIDGLDGAQGPQGISGPAGAAGTAGAPGIQGMPGFDGEDGEVWMIANNSSPSLSVFDATPQFLLMGG